MNKLIVILLLAIIISQAALALIIVDIGYNVRAIQHKPAVMDKLAQLDSDIKHLTHPQTIQRRTIDWVLRRGEFAGVE